jgi:hypothetical protein
VAGGSGSAALVQPRVCGRGERPEAVCAHEACGCNGKGRRARGQLRRLSRRAAGGGGGATTARMGSTQAEGARGTRHVRRRRRRRRRRWGRRRSLPAAFARDVRQRGYVCRRRTSGAHLGGGEARQRGQRSTRRRRSREIGVRLRARARARAQRRCRSRR